MREVRQLRLTRGWNQTELAFHAGLAPSVISQIENGKRDPSASTLRKLAQALEVEVADLFPKGQAPLPDFPAERRPTLDELLQQSGIETRWLLGGRWKFVAALGGRFVGFGDAPPPQDDKKLLDMAREAMIEYRALSPHVHTDGTEHPLGLPTIAPEYVALWMQVVIVRLSQTLMALRSLANDPNAPKELKEEARFLLSSHKDISEDELGQITEEQQFPQKYCG